MDEGMHEAQTNDFEEIDTDKEESRVKRAINHYNFEQGAVKYTEGLPFKDRFVKVRAELFKGFPNIAGENQHKLLSEGNILSDKRAQIMDEYCPTDEAATAALETYVPQVDQWYEEIKRIPEGKEKEEAALRMITAMFVGGIMIHPGRDGNGQTFKGLALSYLHDLLPAYKDRYIPIKYGSKDHDYQHELGIAFMGGGMLSEQEDILSGSVREIEPKDETDNSLMELLVQARHIMYGTLWKDGESFESFNERREKELKALAEEAAVKLEMPQLSQEKISHWAEEKRYWLLKRQIPVYLPVLKSLQQTIAELWKTKGYAEERINATVFGPPGSKRDRASDVVRQVWVEEKGRQVLNQYVKAGGETMEQTEPNDVLTKMVKTLEKQKKHVVEVLETKEEHDKRHIEMMRKLSNT